MRRILIAFFVITTILTFISCARGITVEQAANGKGRCGKNYIR
jgi:hypothetical protein